MREDLYNRHVAFACADGGVWSEPVKPLVGRRILTLDKDQSWQKQQMEGKRIPEYQRFDAKNRSLIDNWAAWDNFRLSQLTDNSFSIRKRATEDSPWIGTFTGTQAGGYAFAGDVSGGMGSCLTEFLAGLSFYPGSTTCTQPGSLTDCLVMESGVRSYGFKTL